MSSWRVPSNTSNGVSSIAVGSISARLGTTFMRSVSMTRHVSVRPNGSATWTALLSVFHQQFKRFVAAPPALAAGVGDWAPPDKEAHPRHPATTSTRRIGCDVLLMPPLERYAP